MTDVTFDTETTGLDMWYPGGGLDGAPARPFMIQVADDITTDGAYGLLGPAADFDRRATASAWASGAEFMRGWMAGAGRRVAHNLSFDVHQLSEGPGWDLLAMGPVADTDHLARIVWPERRFGDERDESRSTHGYKLKNLAKDYVDPDAKDGEEALEELAKKHGFHLKAKPGTKYYRPAAYYLLWTLEPEAMEFYAREDVRLTLGLLRTGEAKLTPGTRRIWELEQAVTPIVIGAERKGICIDLEAAAPLRARFEQERDDAWLTLDQTLGTGWDENNEVLAESLLKHGVPLTEKTASGEQIATNQKALQGFVDEHPIVQQLFDYRLKERFVTTYLDHMTHEVVHPNFWQIGAWTGRMSGSNPNMQNVPTHVGNELRELYVPREGMAFVAIDFEQIELRMLAYYLHDREIQDRVENTDFFAWVASEVNGGATEDYHKGTAGGPERQVCKNATYAIVYGVGGLKLGRMLGWPADAVYGPDDFVVKKGYKKAGEPRCLRAERLSKQIKSILKGYGTPAYRGPGSGSGLLGRISDQVEETGAVNTILGRRQWLGKDGAWKGMSALIQGGAADLFKNALLAAVDAVEQYDAYPLLFIHDEIVFEAPTDAAELVLRDARIAMDGSYDLIPALATEGAIGYKNWGECK